MTTLRIPILLVVLFAAPVALADAPEVVCSRHAAPGDDARCLHILETLARVAPETWATFDACALDRSSDALSACFTPATLDALSRGRHWRALSATCREQLDLGADAREACDDALTLAPDDALTRASASAAALLAQDCERGLGLLQPLDPASLPADAQAQLTDLAASCAGDTPPPDTPPVDSADLGALCEAIIASQPDVPPDECMGFLTQIHDNLGDGPVWESFAGCISSGVASLESCMTEDVTRALTAP